MKKLIVAIIAPVVAVAGAVLLAGILLLGAAGSHAGNPDTTNTATSEAAH